MAKILIVDDSETIRLQLRKCLASAGHTVVEGRNGNEGLSHLQSESGFDLIITDINMPEMDGFTMCTKIHADPGLVHIPIFMLTTESDAAIKEESKEVGVVAWILKPLSGEKLLSAVKKILNKNP